MQRRKPRSLWRSARVCFRCARIVVWLVILALLAAVLHLHLVGLPGFLERPLIASLRERGLDLEFSRIRLTWYQGVVAEDVSLAPVGSGRLPRLHCRRVGLDVDPSALARLQLAVDTLNFTDGVLSLSHVGTDPVDETLTVTNLQAQLRFGSSNVWRLDGLSGEFAGCKLRIHCTVINPKELGQWKLLLPQQPDTDSLFLEHVQRVTKILEGIGYSAPPEIRVGITADGLAPEESSIWLSIMADSVATPGLSLRNAEVQASLTPASDGKHSRIQALLSAADVSFAQGHGRDVQFSASAFCLPAQGRLISGELESSVSQLDTRWFGTRGLSAAAHWEHSASNIVPVGGEINLRARALSAGVGVLSDVETSLEMRATQRAWTWLPELPEGIQVLLNQFDVRAGLRAQKLASSILNTEVLELAGQWRTPYLLTTNLAVSLGGGTLSAHGRLNLKTRELQFAATSDIDPPAVYGVIPTEYSLWLSQFSYTVPPNAQVKGSLLFPPGLPGDPQWPGNLAPSLSLEGYVEAQSGSFKGISVDSASTHFIYSNMFWHIPDLHISRPEGELTVIHVNNDRTSEFLWRVDGAMDVEGAWPLMNPATRNALTLVDWDGPPEAHATVRGFWRDPSQTRIDGEFVFTNFTIRGEHCDMLQTHLRYAEGVLATDKPLVKRDSGTVEAESLTFDFNQGVAHLSNCLSTIDPMTVATVIGPDVARAIEPYRFALPPEAHVEGVIPLHGIESADLKFRVDGGPFEWWRFRLPELGGRIHWRGTSVMLTNMQARFYEGSVQGDAFFDFERETDADFRFNVIVNSANLQDLVSDTFGSTNHLEGSLSGQLVVTNANTADWESWQGKGSADLKDGLIWEIPVFGIVSPVLNAVIPGLGSSRAEEATGTFVITNSVIRSDDLLIQATGTRLRYKGTVDFDGNVDANVEAELLRNTILVGELVSLALTPVSKLFEFKITGTLDDPKAQPLYLLPRLLLAPLNPVKLFKDLFVPGPDEPVPPEPPPSE